MTAWDATTSAGAVLIPPGSRLRARARPRPWPLGHSLLRLSAGARRRRCVGAVATGAGRTSSEIARPQSCSEGPESYQAQCPSRHHPRAASAASATVRCPRARGGSCTAYVALQLHGALLLQRSSVPTARSMSTTASYACFKALYSPFRPRCSAAARQSHLAGWRVPAS